jgi:stearoyl-CoA desaturase (delta-9 desaturase)
MESKVTPELRDAPLYHTFSELFAKGFTLDTTTWVFVLGIHVAVVGLGVWIGFAASQAWVLVAFAWASVHFVVGSLSTTVYSHRLITHNAAKTVSVPVHLVFCLFGQVLSVQGSVRRWSANHVLHHGVDRHGKKELDPYSATWFADTFRNFLWSHTLTHLFNHPNSEEYTRAHKAKRHRIIVWQDRYYGALIAFWIFAVPLVFGFLLGGWIGALSLLAGSLAGSVAVQHNTWTVNSVTHLWGWTTGLKSSAVNNYIWLGPMGEGNHHADHHDFPRDYRNGFGWSGWMLDPTRYVILALAGLGLVKGLNQASRRDEAEIISARKLAKIDELKRLDKDVAVFYGHLESTVMALRKDWLDAVSRWEALRAESKVMQQANASYEELAQEIHHTKVLVKARKQAFFAAVERINSQAFDFAR